MGAHLDRSLMLISTMNKHQLELITIFQLLVQVGIREESMEGRKFGDGGDGILTSSKPRVKTKGFVQRGHFWTSFKAFPLQPNKLFINGPILQSAAEVESLSLQGAYRIQPFTQ